MSADRPDACAYPIVIGTTIRHACRERWMEPVAETRPLRSAS